MATTLERSRHTGIYTAHKYDADIDEYYVNPEFVRQAHALDLTPLIDLTSAHQAEAEINLRRAWTPRGRDALEAQAARYLAAQAFHAKYRPFEVAQSAPNVMITKGVTFLWTASTGAGVTPSGGPPPTANALNYLTSTTAGIGVGDNAGGGKTTALASDTDLDATPNILYMLVNSAPVISGGQITLVISLSGSQANFVIAELIAGNFISATNGSGSTTHLSGTAYSLISHAISALGTKQSGQTWTITFNDVIS